MILYIYSIFYIYICQKLFYNTIQIHNRSLINNKRSPVLAASDPWPESSPWTLPSSSPGPARTQPVLSWASTRTFWTTLYLARLLAAMFSAYSSYFLYSLAWWCSLSYSQLSETASVRFCTALTFILSEFLLSSPAP